MLLKVETELEEEGTVWEYSDVYGWQHSWVERESRGSSTERGGSFTRRVLQSLIEERTN